MTHEETINLIKLITTKISLIPAVPPAPLCLKTWAATMASLLQVLSPSHTQTGLYTLGPLILKPSDLDWNCANGFAGPPANRQQMMGLLSLHNHMSQSLTVILFLYISMLSTYLALHPIGFSEGPWLMLWLTGTGRKEKKWVLIGKSFPFGVMKCSRTSSGTQLCKLLKFTQLYTSKLWILEHANYISIN